MKKSYIFFAIIIVCMSALVSAAPKTVPSGSKVIVTMISQEPDPANPGDIVDLRFKIQNSGSDPTEDLIFEFVEEYPFEVYDGQVQKSVGSLQGVQVEEDSVIILYKIKVDQDAVEREETVDIRYRAAGDTMTPDWVYIKDFPLRVRTRDLIVSAEVASNPDPIPPGKEAVVTIDITNNADSLLRDLVVKLDTSGEDVPFAPIRSTMQKDMYLLESGEKTELKFNLIAEPDSDGGVYKIPLTISYTDATGTSYTREDVIGLKISSKPDILATIEDSEICQENQICTIDIKMVNRGLTNIKLLTAQLESTEEFEVFSQKNVYIGNIDSDDYENVEYQIKVKAKEEMIKIPLKLIYKDSTNEEFEEVKDIMFNQEYNNKLYGSNGQSSVVGYLIVILIVAGGLGFYLWRRKKKSKRKSDNK